MGKVVFVNTFFWPDQSATSQILSDLAFALAQNGTEVHIVCSRQCFGQPDIELPSRERVHGVEVHRIATTRFGRQQLAGRAVDYLSFYLSAAATLVGLLSRGDIVVGKTDPPIISIVTYAAARIKGAQAVNWLQDVFPEVADALGLRVLGRMGSRLLRAARDWSVRKAVANVVIGESMAEYLRQRGAPPASIQVIPNWSDGKQIRPIDRGQNALRLSWGLEPAQLVIGYSGNMGRVHDMQTLLSAAQCLKEMRDIKFLFIGAGSQLEAMKATVVEAGLENVMFQPAQDRARLGESLNVPDVHFVTLMPALEGLVVPSKFYGVLAAGRPTIFVGDTRGEVARAIDQADCGVSFQSGDARGIAHQLEQWSADRSRVVTMGIHARQLFEQRYDRQILVDRWATLLTTLAATPTTISDDVDEARLDSRVGK